MARTDSVGLPPPFPRENRRIVLVPSVRTTFAARERNYDRIAALLPNMPETIAAMLAAASLGAIWSSASPDFGPRGALDRFGQIEPKLFLACDGYHYSGKHIDVADKLREIVAGLPTLVPTLIVPYAGRADEVAATLPAAHALDALLARYEPRPVAYERLPFAHPLYILFSSGTTGM